jgi:hypothetical protein
MLKSIPAESPKHQMAFLFCASTFSKVTTLNKSMNPNNLKNMMDFDAIFLVSNN